MEGFDIHAIMQRIRSAEPGDVRMREIRAGISEAEQVKDVHQALNLHRLLIKESVFSGDRYQALVDFPQYLALLKSNPEEEQERMHDTLWVYKWIVEASAEFYQIEKKQVLKWFSEYRKDLIANGYSLRSWYEKRAIFYYYSDRAKMRMDYEDFLNAPKDDMGDGWAYELDSMVRFELAIGHREKGRECAEKIIQKQVRTDEIPCKTYMYLLDDAIRCGDTEHAAEYAKKLRPLCENNRFQLEAVGMTLFYDAKTDPERGLEFYQQNKHLREHSRNPFLCFWFDRGALRVMEALQAQGKPIPAEAAPEKLRESCRELAEKFDARNGSDFFAKALEE